MALVDVTHSDARSRFETTVDGATAFLTFHRNGKRFVLIHTEVPTELEGRGLGTKLALAAIDYAREHDLTVVPRCPFVRAYLERHPDVAATLTIDWEE